MGKRTEEIRKRIEYKEEKLGRQLNKEEKRKIEKKVISKSRRENLIRGAFLAIGITIGAGGHALLTSGNNSEKQTNTEVEQMQHNTEKSDFKESIKVNEEDLDKTTEKEEIDYNQIITEIINKYNEKYNTELTAEDISYIKSNPQFLGIDENGAYIQDYKQSTPTKEYKRQGIGDTYIMLNNEDGTIISSLGKVNSKIENIDTKIVKDAEGKEYLESNNKIDLTEEKTEDEIKNIYETIEKQYEKEQEQER